MTPDESPTSQPFPDLSDRLHLPRRPRLRLDLDAIAARCSAAYRTVTPEDMHAALLAAVADALALVSEVDRLWHLLVAARLRYADLAAAARATLAAHRDGEADPLAYLADELYSDWPAPGDGR
jgi:hypothetical protein